MQSQWRMPSTAIPHKGQRGSRVKWWLDPLPWYCSKTGGRSAAGRTNSPTAVSVAIRSRQGAAAPTPRIAARPAMPQPQLPTLRHRLDPKKRSVVDQTHSTPLPPHASQSSPTARQATHTHSPPLERLDNRRHPRLPHTRQPQRPHIRRSPSRIPRLLAGQPWLRPGPLETRLYAYLKKPCIQKLIEDLFPDPEDDSRQPQIHRPPPKRPLARPTHAQRIHRNQHRAH